MRRRVSFAEMSISEPPEQSGAERYPVSPHPVRLQPDGAAQNRQPGNAGPSRLLHTPKKSILRPRGSKAQVSELAPSDDLPAPAAKSAARSVGFSEASQSTAGSAKSKGASFAGSSGDSRTSSGPGTRTYDIHESPVMMSPVRTSAPNGKGSNECIRDAPAQGSPSTPKSPTALQAKLQRLRAKWSSLAGHAPSASDSHDALKSGGVADQALTNNTTAVDVTASAPFTIIQLDREESAGPYSLPDSGHVTTSSAQAASASEETGASSSSAMTGGQADSARETCRHDDASSMPARSAWEEALGLPAGVNLWGPTVLELPYSDSSTELSTNTGTDQASSAPPADILYLTAPRPVAEAVETESFDESSQLTSPTTATLSITEMRSPESHTETESALYVQGNSLYEDQASTVSSSTLTPSTLTLETASATVDGLFPRHHQAKEACTEEPAGAPPLNPGPIQAAAGALPTEIHHRLTLDQVLSTERAPPLGEASDIPHIHTVQQQSSIPAGRMRDRMQGGSAGEPGLDPAAIQPAAAASAARDASGNNHVPSSCQEQDAVSRSPHAQDPISLGCITPEPAALDRGEPTFEENMKLQQTKSTGKKGGQLLSPRKQALSGQQAHGSGPPQRSFSPFGRLGCLPRAHSQEECMPVSPARNIDSSSKRPKQAAESANGPGPLETGIHQVELGGYYLTTPDPLRTDPGFALRWRTSSEQSGQSAVQHAQHGSDPLNCDPVQYVSSPSWRMSALSALDMLQPSLAPGAASDSEAWQTVPRPGPSPASMQQLPALKARSQHRYEDTGDIIKVGDAAWLDRRPEARDDAGDRARKINGEVPLSFARVHDSMGKEGSSRVRIEKKNSRGSLGKAHIHRHMAGDHACPSMSEVSSWQPSVPPQCCHTTRFISWAILCITA